MIRILHKLIHDFRYAFCRIPAAYRNPLPQTAYRIVQQYKKTLILNNEPILASVFGAASRKKQRIRTVGKTAQMISILPSYGTMLYWMVSMHKPDLIIEMGTALGISTSYLALALPEIEVITMEGNSQYADIARKQFAEYHLSNITLLNGKFEDILPGMHPHAGKRLLVFIDGNHTYDATWAYFDFFHRLENKNLILIFDDINWSQEMFDVWKLIKTNATGYRKIDLFRCGILIRGY